MNSSISQIVRKSSSLVLCAVACLGVGCHSRHNVNSGYGVAWITLTAEPGNFTGYIARIDSVTFTRSDGQVFTALATVEPVDFVKLGAVSELYGTATIPIGTYTAATVTLDYTSASVAVPVNGVPQIAKVVGPTNAAVTTVPVVVTFDTANPLVIAPTPTTSSAVRVALDLNLAASNGVNLTTIPATVTVNPFITASVLSPDQKLIRVRGPLTNSSVPVGTYSVQIRPFYDEVNSLGSLTLFNDANTVYTINGTTYVGSAGLTALSQTSAGTTMTAAYTTFVPTSNTNASPAYPAGKFNPQYVVAGSTLEDFYTQGIEGDVIARSGSTLKLRGSILSLNSSGTFSYLVNDASVTVGASTIVTADGNSHLSGLSSSSIGVGQHIEVRGLYSLPSPTTPTVDATGATSTNTGSVRLEPTALYGSVVSAGAGSVAMNLQSIGPWPVSIFDFTGNGATAAQNPAASNFLVNPGTVAVPPGTISGTPLWISGYVTPFGSAPPDFTATAISTQAAVPASLRVNWTGSGTGAPFSGLANTGFSINLANANYGTGVIQIGTETIDLKSLAASPQIAPTTAPITTTFAPLFAVGSAAAGIAVFSGFPAFVTKLNSTLSAKLVQQFEARGLYNPVTNVFTATTVEIVL